MAQQSSTPQQSGGESEQQSSEEKAVSVQVIENVHLIDVENGRLVENQTVVIEGTKIAHVGAADGRLNIPENAQRIDGAGKFLIPGLFDAHVHLMTSMPSFSALMLAHGVTTCRDTGAATEVILNARRRSREPDEPMPMVFATGAIVDGNPPVWPFSKPCENAQEARAAVRELAAQDVDQIKVYTLLPKPAYLAAVDEAHKLNLKAIGHVAESVTLQDALEAGQDGIEHLDGLDRLLAELHPELIEGEGRSNRMMIWQNLDQVDWDRVDEHLKKHADAGIVHCPTLVVMEGIGRITDEDRPGNEDPRMKHVHPFVAAFWSRGYDRFSPIARGAVPGMKQMVKRMHENGVTLVTGTDLANPFVFAGSSLHDEMKMFVDAGIPTADVLRMATLEPARLVDAESRLGTIEPGKLASLVLLENNPLESIDHVRDIVAVWRTGTYYDREKLAELIKPFEQQPREDESGEDH